MAKAHHRLTKFLIFILLQFLFPNSVIAQKDGFIYEEGIIPGSQVYVLTNRLAGQGGNSITYQNKIKPVSSLSYLRATFHNKDSIVYREIDSSLFLSEVSSFIGDWLLFVHGDGKTLETAVWRSFDIQHLHEINVIVFSWPSRNPKISGAKNFKNSQQNVIQSGDHFDQVLQLMQRFRQVNPGFSDNHNLSLFVHSLGNFYLENLAKKRITSEKPSALFDNLIMNAAAVNQENHKVWVEQLVLQERIYITNNRQDFNLKGVRIFTKQGKQLGEKVTHPVADNAVYVQFTKAVGFRFPTGTTHTYFIGKVPEKYVNIRNFYYQLLHGQPIEINDNTLFSKRKDGIGYDIISKTHKH